MSARSRDSFSTRTELSVGAKKLAYNLTTVAPGKRASARPNMKAVLSGEFDTESELDVPTFIRRHAHHS